MNDGPGVSSSPIDGRRSRLIAFALTLVAYAVFPSGAAAGPALSLADVLGRMTPDAAELAGHRAEASRAEAAVLTAALLDNPFLSYTREDLIPPGPGDQDVLSLGLPLEIGGEPGLRKAVAAARAESAREALKWGTTLARARVRTLYRHWRAAVERAEREEEFLAALVPAEAAIAARVEAGDVSSYDLLRLRMERARHEALAAAFRADGVAHRGDLEVALGASLPDDAYPADPLPSPDPTASVPGMRSDLRTALRREDAAREARRLAARAWVPELTLMVGLNHVHGMGTELLGYVVGLELELPVFDTGRRHRARAEKELAATVDVRSSLEARVDLERRAARSVYRSRVEVLRTFRETLVRSRELPEVAAAAYGAGEMDVVGLLDAHRSVLEAGLVEVDLALSAALAWDALRLASGEEGGP